MKFKLPLWNVIDIVSRIVITILIIYICGLITKGTVGFVLFGGFGSIVILFLLLTLPNVSNFLLMNEPVTNSISYCKSNDVYSKLNALKECLNNEYDNFDSLKHYDYYYDHMVIVMKYKSIGLKDYCKYLFKGDDNSAFEFDVKVEKFTQRLHVEGILKTKINDGCCTYSIGNYIFDEDKQRRMSSLANNQEIQLDVIYDKDFESDGHIRRYVIINADTKERLQ